MRKINQKQEKRERNEEYAKRFESKKTGRKKAIYLNWCRIDSHPASCRCAFR